MIIECTNCHARYQYGAERFEGRPAKKIKCARCQTIFEIRNPSTAPAAADASGEADGDSTALRPPKPVPAAEPGPAEDTGGLSSGGLRLPAGKRISLAIIDGNGAGTVFRMERPRVTIGRSGADMVIDDTEASRNHAAIEVHDTVCVLKDLNSTNGTLVDGAKITSTVQLQDKSEFQIGTTTLMLIITEET